MNCVACGLELETHEYQTRSADEAHTTVTTCAKCPIDAAKLDPTSMPGVPYRGLRWPIKRPLHVRVCSAGSRIGSISTVVIDVPRGHEYYDIDLPHEHVTTSHRIMSTTMGGASLEKNGLYSVTGPFQDQCVSEIESKTIGMGISVIEYGTYTPASTTVGQQRTVTGTYTRAPTVAKLQTYVYCASGSSNRKLIVVLSDQRRQDQWISVVNSAMLQALLPESASRYVKSDIIARLSNISARAWDATSPPETGHTFTCKPDGERTWLVLYGSIWYMVPPRFRGQVKQWYVTLSRTNTDDVVVIDVEYLGRHGFVLIDVLTSCDGTAAPASRDMNWVINQFHSINTTYRPPPITVRHYFSLYADAMLYSTSMLYPTDGVVAVRDGSTEILKIKDVKSMELLHDGEGVLLTADGDKVATSTSAASFDKGDIIEIRFTIDKDTREMNITDVFRRIDKSVPNSTSAVTNIISSGFKLKTKDDNDRRAALIWCNELRKSIHKRALGRRDNRSIILDVGSGDGQSLDSMMASQSTSCVYVEPDEGKCKKLARRLNTKRIYTDPMDVIPMVRSLKTRLVNNIVLNCTLRTVTNCGELLLKLLPELKCIVCTFSMHFIADELQDISSVHAVPIYGCGYLYDNINDDGVLIDTSGVVMKVVGDNDAVVKWGGDEEYREPVTTTFHYGGLGRMVKGTDALSPPDVSVNPGAVAICDKVYVLMP
jgi:hypothetical protein